MRTGVSPLVKNPWLMWLKGFLQESGWVDERNLLQSHCILVH